MKLRKRQSELFSTTTAPTSQLHTHQLQFNSIDTDTFLPAPPCQSSNGGWRPSSREVQLHSLLQYSPAWRICVTTGSHPRWRLTTTSQNLDDFTLQPIDGAVFKIKNPYFHPPAQSAGADDGASTGMGRSGWGGILNVLPLISWPPLRFIQQCRRRPDWTLMDIEQPPLPCHDAIHRSG